MTTLSIGTNIAAADYNSLQTTVSNILGVGGADPTYGYGQGVLSTQVSIGDVISHTDWANLKADILKIAGHQGTTTDPNIIALPTISVANEIDANDINKFENAVPVLVSNRFADAQFSIETLNPDVSCSRNAAWGSNVLPTVTHAFTLSFPDSNSARYFFNTGGTVEFKASRTGGSTSTQNTDWTNILASFSTGSNSVIFNYNSCTAVSGQNSSIGWYQLTSTPQIVFKKSGNGGESGGSPYAVNNYHIEMSCDVANNNTGTAKKLYVTVYFSDIHTSSSDIVDGTLTSTVYVTRATGSNVSVIGPTGVNTTTLGTGVLPSKLATTTGLTASPTSLAPGGNTTLTATINPSVGTGTVKFYDNGTAIGSPVTVSGGTATYTYNSLSSGVHSLVAVYSGDVSYNLSSSLPLTLTVAKLTTTLALTTTSNTPTYGVPFTLTATTTPSTATGTIAFYDGNTNIGNKTLSSGIATLNVSTLKGGSHPNIYAFYLGDNTYQSSTSQNLTITVGKTTTTAVLTSSSYTITQGTSTQLTCTLGANDATGTVTFYNISSGNNLGSSAVSNGNATISTNNYDGPNTIVYAKYNGDSSYQAQTSNNIAISVNTKSTTLTINTSSSIVQYNSFITLTASLAYTGTDRIPTGTVTFKDGSTVLSTNTISTTTNPINTQLATSMLAVGTHSITATYNGDNNNGISVSAPVQVTVNRASPTISFTQTPASTSIFGQSVSLKASLTPTVVTGTVFFYDGVTALGNAPVNQGIAQFAASNLTAGSHSLTATYSGDANYNSVTSSITNYIVAEPIVSVILNGAGGGGGGNDQGGKGGDGSKGDQISFNIPNITSRGVLTWTIGTGGAGGYYAGGATGANGGVSSLLGVNYSGGAGGKSGTAGSSGSGGGGGGATVMAYNGTLIGVAAGGGGGGGSGIASPGGNSTYTAIGGFSSTTGQTAANKSGDGGGGGGGGGGVVGGLAGGLVNGDNGAYGGLPGTSNAYNVTGIINSKGAGSAGGTGSSSYSGYGGAGSPGTVSISIPTTYLPYVTITGTYTQSASGNNTTLIFTTSGSMTFA
jgi:Bacterial Ig-like domain (group 3)